MLSWPAPPAHISVFSHNDLEQKRKSVSAFLLFYWNWFCGIKQCLIGCQNSLQRLSFVSLILDIGLILVFDGCVQWEPISCHVCGFKKRAVALTNKLPNTLLFIGYLTMFWLVWTSGSLSERLLIVDLWSRGDSNFLFCLIRWWLLILLPCCCCCCWNLCTFGAAGAC